VELTLLSHKKKTSQKIDTDHYWYDHINKIMLHGRGGRMEFAYDSTQRRLMPQVVDHVENVWTNDYPLIKEWVSRNQSKYGIDVVNDTGKNITISVSASQLDEITRDLYNNRIISDYDPTELKMELKRGQINSAYSR
jgi:hypothetical protein